MAAESKRRDGAMVIRSSPGGGAMVRRATEPSSGSSSNGALSFLERSHRSDSSSLPAAVTSPWPVGFKPPHKAARDRATSAGGGGPHRLPRTSALAFLERPPVEPSGGAAANSLVSSAEAGLGWLGEGFVSTGSSRGELLRRSHSSVTGSGSEDSDEDIMLMDSSICPSMLFSCFPCFSCLRYVFENAHGAFPNASSSTVVGSPTCSFSVFAMGDGCFPRATGTVEACPKHARFVASKPDTYARRLFVLGRTAVVPAVFPVVLSTSGPVI